MEQIYHRRNNNLSAIKADNNYKPLLFTKRTNNIMYPSDNINIAICKVQPN